MECSCLISSSLRDSDSHFYGYFGGGTERERGIHRQKVPVPVPVLMPLPVRVLSNPPLGIRETFSPQFYDVQMAN